MKHKKDYYKILEVNPDATQAEIRRAYRRLALQNHPDRNPGAQSTALMQEINEAYGVIGDQTKRKKYDLERPASPPPPRQKTYASERPASPPPPRQKTYASACPASPPPPRQKTYASERPASPPPPRQKTYTSERPVQRPPKRAESAARSIIDTFTPTVRRQVFAQAYQIVLTVSLLFALTVDVIAVRILSTWKTGIFLAFLFALTLNAALAYGVLIFREYFLSVKSESRCPRCSQQWASEKLEEQMLGFFDVLENNGDKWGQINWRKKPQTRHRCIHCGHEWEFMEVKKQRATPLR